MKERIRLFFKYTILRYRVSKKMYSEWTKEEIELLLFVKFHIRTSSSIEIDNNSFITKIKSGAIEFILHKDRLIVTNVNSYLDVKVGVLVQREINIYVQRVLEYRILIFNKKCKAQIKKLINGF